MRSSPVLAILVAMESTSGDDDVRLIELHPRLHRRACRLAGDPVDAEDLVQETCVRALAARQSFTPGTNYGAWLFTILRNLVANRRRLLATHPQAQGFDDVIEAELGPDPAANVEREVIARADLSAVMRAFRALPPVFAEPLRLVAIEERSYAEVSAALGIPIG